MQRWQPPIYVLVLPAGPQRPLDICSIPQVSNALSLSGCPGLAAVSKAREGIMVMVILTEDIILG